MRFWMLAALAVVAGAVAALLWPAPEIAPTLRDRPESWHVPGKDQLSRYSANLFSRARAGLRWDQQDGGDESSGNWRLAGIAREASPIALVEVQGKGKKKQIIRAAEGEQLPDGARVVAIEDGEVLVERDGCRIRVRLYPIQAQQPRADECDNAPEGVEKGQE